MPTTSESLQVHIARLATASSVLVHELHLEVAAGHIHTVMGASGSGKSSVLAAICGTLAPGLQFAGSVMLGGRRIDQLPTEQRKVGILFQDDLLFGHMTVAENLLFAVPAGPAAERRARVAAGLADLELTALAEANPATLSGGQRARVALMRALLAEPQALLLDEPFSRLDAGLRARVRDFVFARVRKRGIPTLMVTHDESDIADPAHLTLLN
jgi:putative thiamine transport system ATP-binding protein